MHSNWKDTWLRRVTEHNPGRQWRGISLFTCQSSSGTLSSHLPISARPSWKEEAVRQIICFKGSPSFSDSPWLFLAPPITSLCFATHQSLLPSAPPSPRGLPMPICAPLVTPGTYLVLPECLCNQTYTYLLVRHSNGRLIMKLHHCELTTGKEMYKFHIASSEIAYKGHSLWKKKIPVLRRHSCSIHVFQCISRVY